MGLRDALVAQPRQETKNEDDPEDDEENNSQQCDLARRELYMRRFMRTALRLLSVRGGNAVHVGDGHPAIVVALTPAKFAALFLVFQFLFFSFSHAG